MIGTCHICCQKGPNSHVLACRCDAQQFTESCRCNCISVFIFQVGLPLSARNIFCHARMIQADFNLHMHNRSGSTANTTKTKSIRAHLSMSPAQSWQTKYRIGGVALT